VWPFYLNCFLGLASSRFSFVILDMNMFRVRNLMLKFPFIRTGLFGVSLLGNFVNVTAQSTAVELELAVNKALVDATNDASAIEAVLQKMMADLRPTPAGMKTIASAAMKTASNYNKHDLMAAITEGSVRAGLVQAQKSGVDPVQAAAAIADGLVSSAMGTTSRRGGNSVVTSLVVSQQTVISVVVTSGQLGIPASNAANAAAFGAMKAAFEISLEYGIDPVAVSMNLTSGITQGSVFAAQRIGVDAEAIAQAAMIGIVDSLDYVSGKTNIDVDPSIDGAKRGYFKGMQISTGRGVKARPEKREEHREITGTNIIPKTIPVRNPESGMIEVRLESPRPLAEGLQYFLIKNGKEVAGPNSQAIFVIGSQPTALNVGVYSIQVRQPGDSRTLDSTPTTLAMPEQETKTSFFRP
jgi:hypothetical protein